MTNTKYLTMSFISAFLLSACATGNSEKIALSSSFLKGKTVKTNINNAKLLVKKETLSTEEQEQFRFVPSFKLGTYQSKSANDILNRFSNVKTLKITANALPLKDFLNQVFGEQLKLSYILAQEISKDKKPVSLNLQQPITERKLFTLTEELLAQRDYLIRFDDDIFYIRKTTGKGARGDVMYGYGKNYDDIPKTSLKIIQMIPFEYGVQTSLANSLRQLLGVTAIVDFERSSITVQGKRKEIVRAVKFIQLMDQPAFRNRQIAIFKTTFLSSADLIKKMPELLLQDGISVAQGNSTEKALSIVQLEKQGMLVFFASNSKVIKRALFWAEQIDKPIVTDEKQYFIFQPQYSRAIDMGESLQRLFGGGDNRSRGVGSQTSAQAENSRNLKPSGKSLSASLNNMKVVVDERANALIFYTSGKEYQRMLPLIKRLDVIPKQVILEVMIAEVTLTDEFKQGVEFALNNGNYGISTLGAFMGQDGFGGLSYLLQGNRGSLAINMFQTNSLVNILSRPTLVVRDGVSASISVGNDIPIIGQTTSNPIDGLSQTTKIEYRKTGIELNVTPTINAQGVIIMEIDQRISSEIEGGGTVSNSPAFFERSIRTEVVAESGQTIMLGGLISENKTKSRTSVPFFSSLPLIGALFQAEKDGGDKTELVVLVTPRVIESSDEWDDVLKKFSESVTQLNINQ